MKPDREGRFWQDQKMHPDSVPILVERSQFTKVWKSWSNAYPDLEPMNDPVPTAPVQNSTPSTRRRSMLQAAKDRTLYQTNRTD